MASPRVWLLTAVAGVVLLGGAACSAGGGAGWAAPTVADGRLLVPDGDRLVALDLERRDVLWEFPAPDSKTDLDRVYGAPVTVDGKSYLAAYDGTVYVLEAETGREAWRYKLQGHVAAGVAVADGTIFVGDGTGRLYAIKNGQLQWEFRAGDRIWSTPVVDERSGTVYATSLDGALYAVAMADGSERWRFETDAAVASTPALADGVLYFGSFDKRMYAVDAVSGRELWSSGPAENWFWTTAVVGSDTVYAGNLDGNVYAFSREDGSERWRFDAGAPLRSGAALVERPGVLVVAGRDGTVYGLDPSTGSPRWAEPARIDKKVLADLTAEGSTVYVRTESNGVWTVDAGTGRLERLTIPDD